MSSSEFLHKLVNTSTSKSVNFLIGSVHLGLESDSLDCSFWWDCFNLVDERTDKGGNK